MKRLVLILVAIVLANFFFAAGFSPLLEPLLYTMTPFERYYAGDYLASAWHASDPLAVTETQLLWKSRPVPDPSPKLKKTTGKFQTELALERDVAPRPMSERIGKYAAEPFGLSDGARAEGWTAIYRGLPQKVESGKLERILQAEVYGGAALWRFFLQPAAGAAGLSVVWLLLHLWRRRLRKQYPWRTDGEAMWFAVRQWGTTSASRSIGKVRRLPTSILRLAPSPPTRLELPAPAPQSGPVASVAAPKSPPDIPAAPSAATITPPVPSRPAYVWNESEGIE